MKNKLFMIVALLGVFTMAAKADIRAEIEEIEKPGRTPAEWLVFYESMEKGLMVEFASVMMEEKVLLDVTKDKLVVVEGELSKDLRKKTERDFDKYKKVVAVIAYIERKYMPTPQEVLAAGNQLPKKQKGLKTAVLGPIRLCKNVHESAADLKRALTAKVEKRKQQANDLLSSLRRAPAKAKGAKGSMDAKFRASLEEALSRVSRNPVAGMVRSIENSSAFKQMAGIGGPVCRVVNDQEMEEWLPEQ